MRILWARVWPPSSGNYCGSDVSRVGISRWHRAREHNVWRTLPRNRSAILWFKQSRRKSFGLVKRVFCCAAPCQGPLACPHCLARPWPARALSGHKSLTRHNRASLWTRLSELMSTLTASSSRGLRAHLRLLRIPYLTSTCQEESGDWGEWGG